MFRTMVIFENWIKFVMWVFADPLFCGEWGADVDGLVQDFSNSIANASNSYQYVVIEEQGHISQS